jgi:hypothetical protein
MKKQIILVTFMLIGLTNCENPKSIEEVRVDAQNFKQQLLQVKSFGKTFLALFGVTDQKQLKSLTFGEAIPVVFYNNKNIETTFDWLNKQSASYYLLPCIIDSKVVCLAYFSTTGSSFPVATPISCSVLKNGGTASINGKVVPVGLNHNKVYFEMVYTDMLEFEIGILKYKDELYGIPLRNSFMSEKGFQLTEGQGYTFKSIQQILEKNLGKNKIEN